MKDAAPLPSTPLRRWAVPAAILMLVGWGSWTFAGEAPGWVHLFLILGVFLLIWGIVARGTPDEPAAPPRDGTRSH